MAAQAERAVVAFGAGCFWGTQKFFVKQFGSALAATKVGYMGGNKDSPSYKDVCTGETGHAEVLHVEYFPEKVKFADLCHFFFRMHDPTTLNRQQGDVGTQYRSAIFYQDEDQKNVAEAVIKELSESEHFKGRKIVTQVVPMARFWDAEEYHQDYLEKNPGGYCSHKLYW